MLADAAGLHRGAYVLADLGQGEPQIILMATGSEVDLIVGAGKALTAEGISVRLVSFPSWDLFEMQDQAYRDSVLPPQMKIRLAVEAGVPQGWERYTGCEGATITIDHYGASAPFKKIFQEFGFTPENVAVVARRLLGKD